MSLQQEDKSVWDQGKELLFGTDGLIKSFADLNIAKQQAKYGIEAEDERFAPTYLQGAAPAPSTDNAYTADGGNWLGADQAGGSLPRWVIYAVTALVLFLLLVFVLKAVL